MTFWLTLWSFCCHHICCDNSNSSSSIVLAVREPPTISTPHPHHPYPARARTRAFSACLNAMLCSFAKHESTPGPHFPRQNGSDGNSSNAHDTNGTQHTHRLHNHGKRERGVDDWGKKEERERGAGGREGGERKKMTTQMEREWMDGGVTGWVSECIIDFSRWQSARNCLFLAGS